MEACEPQIGTQVVGRNWNGLPDNPCRVKRIPSPIPTRRWYLQPWVISLMGGLLPFGSIFIEMYFVFTSFWNYKASLLDRLMLQLQTTVPLSSGQMTVVRGYLAELSSVKMKISNLLANGLLLIHPY